MGKREFKIIWTLFAIENWDCCLQMFASQYFIEADNGGVLMADATSTEPVNSRVDYEYI